MFRESSNKRFFEALQNYHFKGLPFLVTKQSTIEKLSIFFFVPWLILWDLILSKSPRSGRWQSRIICHIGSMYAHVRASCKNFQNKQLSHGSVITHNVIICLSQVRICYWYSSDCVRSSIFALIDLICRRKNRLRASRS